MTDDYAPFPESELTRLAGYHEDVAKSFQSDFVKGLHMDRAAACRNAIRSHEALRERCLVAELDLAQAQRSLRQGAA